MAKRIVTRTDVIKVLMAWQVGEMSTQDVYRWADDLYPFNYEAVDWEGAEDGDSATSCVLSMLEKFDMDLALPEDAAIYLEFLAAPKGQFAAAYDNCQKQLGTIDKDARKNALRNDPFYGPILGRFDS
jgi:hypothetical protein